MRIVALIVTILGLAIAAGASYLGCNAVFASTGRHVADVHPLTPGAPATTFAIRPSPDRRYTVGVEVAFGPGEGEIEAKLPLVAKVTNASGGSVASVTDWVDPAQPPTVVVKRTAERFVGPFQAVSREPFDVSIVLGEDRVGTFPIVEARAVVYDDATTIGAPAAFAVAGVGALIAFVGMVLLVLQAFRRSPRRSRKPRSKQVA